MKIRTLLLGAWLIAFMAMIGSLYFSDVKMLEPCHLCWYQRIAIYPLALLLFIAVWKDEDFIVPYVILFPVIGFVISLYQVIIQSYPGFEVVNACGAGPSCTEKLNIGLGPITIPMLSLGSQFATLALLLWAYFLQWREKRSI